MGHRKPFHPLADAFPLWQGEALQALVAAGLLCSHPAANWQSAPAAKLVNVSPRLVHYARNVLRGGSEELIAAVESGSVAVSTAATSARPPRLRPPVPRQAVPAPNPLVLLRLDAAALTDAIQARGFRYVG
jgi:hypothetical protein